MKFSNPGLIFFRDEILRVADKFSLDPDNLTIESFMPGNNVILVETVGKNKFRIHINLQENRIVSAKQLDTDHVEMELFEKYTTFMK